MRRKLVIVVVGLWLGSLIGGAMFGAVEREWNMRTRPAGVVELERLYDMYTNQSLKELQSQCASDENNSLYLAYMPQILYLEWAADWQLSRNDDCDKIAQRFAKMFPHHELGARMHFTMATSFLAASDIQSADREFQYVESRFPKSQLAHEASLVRISTTSEQEFVRQ